MPSGWPVVITDGDGDTIEVEPRGDRVRIETPGQPVDLDGALLEELAQAIVAASHERERQARPAPCGAVSPYPGAACGQYGDHAEHIARRAGGMIVASWPVSDG